MVKTLVVTLDVGGNYEPEITKITYPRMKAWAHKIGADWAEITENKYPHMPIVMNKFQVPRIAQGFDWCYFVDADALISINTPPLHEWITKDQVLFWGLDANNRYKTDNYARRNRQFKSACTWWILTSDWTRDDLFDPTLPPNWEDNIVPNKQENLKSVRSLVDDYKLTVNMDRYGLHAITAMELLKSKGLANTYLHHTYNITTEQKLNGVPNPQWTATNGQPKFRPAGLIEIDKTI